MNDTRNDKNRKINDTLITHGHWNHGHEPRNVFGFPKKHTIPKNHSKIQQTNHLSSRRSSAWPRRRTARRPRLVSFFFCCCLWWVVVRLAARAFAGVFARFFGCFRRRCGHTKRAVRTGGVTSALDRFIRCSFVRLATFFLRFGIIFARCAISFRSALWLKFCCIIIKKCILNPFKLCY